MMNKQKTTENVIYIYQQHNLVQNTLKQVQIEGEKQISYLAINIF